LPNEFEDLLLARGEFSHRCSAEHYNRKLTDATESVRRSAFGVRRSAGAVRTSVTLLDQDIHGCAFT
jgi:hypothetical protein